MAAPVTASKLSRAAAYFAPRLLWRPSYPNPVRRRASGSGRRLARGRPAQFRLLIVTLYARSLYRPAARFDLVPICDRARACAVQIQPCFPAPAVPLGLGLERLHLRGHLFIHLLPHSARILDLALETSILHILRAFSSPTTDHLIFAENSNPCARQARQQPIHRPVAASVPCAVTAMSPMRWER